MNEEALYDLILDILKDFQMTFFYNCNDKEGNMLSDQQLEDFIKEYMMLLSGSDDEFIEDLE